MIEWEEREGEKNNAKRIATQEEQHRERSDVKGMWQKDQCEWNKKLKSNSVRSNSVRNGTMRSNNVKE